MKDKENAKVKKQWLNDWPTKRVAEFQEEFLGWYEQERRILPWRENQDPYRIWVSEIMLQQTRVETVIPYFLRFTEWFPSIQALAQAEEERLLKAWEGLGYYSRVRNMQKAAQQIVELHDGQMPNEIQKIQELKGIGPYTAGAIASIAFNLPEPAIDGNVMRVFSRLFEITDDIAKPSSRKVFEQAVRLLISPNKPSEFNQAIMDLGSGICTPTSPKCEKCPIQKYCLAYEKKEIEKYPVKSKKVKAKPVYYLALAIQNEAGAFLFEQRKKEGLLANMWMFPLVEIKEAEFKRYLKQWQAFLKEKEPSEQLELLAEDNEPLGETNLTHFSFAQSLAQLERYSETVVWLKQPVGEVTHIFSHLKWFILLANGYVKNQKQFQLAANQRWLKIEETTDVVLPKHQQKLLEFIKKQNSD
ncbi:A/G-specific adenine glycosylase [Vagococcus entomophilus]|uniref:A/G-specific adenine glycosylase n=1 Tax=Vagococcus entomophilus TaxID=1160095 RepID=UPI000F85EDA9|nr:A/G-specific adenine glycosylase [Vagococcus entomophilus]